MFSFNLHMIARSFLFEWMTPFVDHISRRATSPSAQPAAGLDLPLGIPLTRLTGLSTIFKPVDLLPLSPRDTTFGFQLQPSVSLDLLSDERHFLSSQLPTNHAIPNPETAASPRRSLSFPGHFAVSAVCHHSSTKIPRRPFIPELELDRPPAAVIHQRGREAKHQA